MKIKINKLILFIGCFLFLTSCIEIKEIIYLKKNGSGTYKLLIDMSQLQSLLGKNGMMNAEGSSSSFSNLDKGLDSITNILNNLEGITNIQKIMDTAQFVFGMKFDFKNIRSLDNLMSKLQSFSKNKNISFVSVFNYEGKIFNRGDMPGGILQEIITEISKDNSTSEMNDLLLNNVNYNFIYTFDRKVKKMANPDALLSEDKKTVLLKRSLREILQDKKSVGNIITLK